MRISCPLSILFALSLVVSAGAQRDEVAVNIDDGAMSKRIATLADGQWTGGDACAAASADRREGRLTSTGDRSVYPVRLVKPGSAEWLRVSPTILTLFETREREQRLAADRTVTFPRVVDWIYVVDPGGGPVYYFEASRRVASVSADVDLDTDPPGTVRIAVAGFLRETAGTFASSGTKSELRWEQDGLPAGPARPDLTPLGVLGPAERPIWVMNGRSGTSAWFVLYELAGTTTRTLLRVSNGC
jgi:hypothetical protein